MVKIILNHRAYEFEDFNEIKDANQRNLRERMIKMIKILLERRENGFDDTFHFKQLENFLEKKALNVSDVEESDEIYDNGEKT